MFQINKNTGFRNIKLDYTIATTGKMYLYSNRGFKFQTVSATLVTIHKIQSKCSIWRFYAEHSVGNITAIELRVPR